MKQSTLNFFIVFFIISILLMGLLLQPFSSILVLGAVFAAILYPFYIKLCLKLKLKSVPSALIICLMMFIIASIIAALFAGIISNEAYNLFVAAKGAVLREEFFSIVTSEKLDKINMILSKFNLELTREDILKPFAEVSGALGKTLVDQASMVASNIFKLAISFFMFLIILFFLLIDGKGVVDYIIRLSPLPKEESQTIINKFREMAGAVLIVNGIAGVIQGMAGGIYFKLLGIPSPFLWGIVMAIFAFLPLVGIGVVMFPVAVFLFIKGETVLGIVTVIFYMSSSMAAEYFFKPKFVGDKVKVHPLLVFLGVIGGLKVFGVLGIIYGPLIVTLFLTLSDIYNKKYQKMVE